MNQADLATGVAAMTTHVLSIGRGRTKRRTGKLGAEIDICLPFEAPMITDCAPLRQSISEVTELLRRVEQLESALTKAVSNPSVGIVEGRSGPSASADANIGRPVVEPHSASANEDGHHSGVGPRQRSPAFSHNLPVAPTSIWNRGDRTCHLGQSWFYKGTALLSDDGLRWISARTGEQLTWERFPLVFALPNSILPWTMSPPMLRASVRDLGKLPRKDVAERLLNVFSNTAFRLTWPFLPHDVVMEAFEMAYNVSDTVLSSSSTVLAKACVSASIALASRYEDDARISSLVDGDVCAAKAQSLLHHVQSNGGVVGLVTMVLLVSPEPIFCNSG